MRIPPAWAKASGQGLTRDRRQVRFTVWGWGDDPATARREAASRLERLLDRVRRGEPFPGAYAYGERPFREEIVETIDGAAPAAPQALVTRNLYGALILNTSRLLFLDVDLPTPGLGERLRRLVAGRRAALDERGVAALREALRQFGGATFRVYRTASGLRAMAIDRDFDPAGREAQDLMRATGTDPAFARLCAAQQSFRARLTPKPWRCGAAAPPGQYPRDGDELRRRFAAWVSAYERASAGYATCRYVETVGSGRPSRSAERLVAVHDRVTRCAEALPLA